MIHELTRIVCLNMMSSSHCARYIYRTVLKSWDFSHSRLWSHCSRSSSPPLTLSAFKIRQIKSCSRCDKINSQWITLVKILINLLHRDIIFGVYELRRRKSQLVYHHHHYNCRQLCAIKARMMKCFVFLCCLNITTHSLSELTTQYKKSLIYNSV